MKKLILILILLAVAAAGFYYVSSNDGELNRQSEPREKITNFKECVAAGNSVMESYPPKCSSGGETFTQDIGNELELQDSIKADNPRPGQKISSPVTVTGEARGTWFFEASFPVRLEDMDGNVLAEGVAQAVGDWMTEDFVPYSVELSFEASGTNTGNLFLEKANPSGLPENDQELRVPVEF